MLHRCVVILAVIVLMSGGAPVSAQGAKSQSRPPALIPEPQEISWTKGAFTFGRGATVVPGKAFSEGTVLLVNQWVKAHAPAAKGPAQGKSTPQIVLSREEIAAPVNAQEAYRLTVAPERISIKANTDAGVFYALQTLKQLTSGSPGAYRIPTCAITDWPAFKIRGFMHDVGRNFQTIDHLKKQMDLFASYKLNVFHMHLTDRPGFRVESVKYPQLNAAENMRATRKPGRFYTRDELRDFIAFCKTRHIMVIPELDMPGHSDYFPTTFGFDMQSREGVEVLKALIGEWCEIFDAPYFHIGSDEVHIKMKDFVPQVVEAVRAHGRKVIQWLPGAPPNDKEVITQLWSRKEALAEGNAYIDSRANYINHMDALVAPVRMYFQQPCRVPQGHASALGGILCYWPDTRVDDEEVQLKIGPVYSAMVAYSESIWRGVQANQPQYWAKLPQKGTPAFESFEKFESRLIEHRDRFFKERPFAYVRQTNIPWKLIGPFPGAFDRVFGPERDMKSSYVVDDKTYTWQEEVAWGGTIHLKHFFKFPGHLKAAASSGTVFARTWIHSDRAQDAHMWLNFNSLSLSGGRRSLGNPPEGQWSSILSDAWLNGRRLEPPQWNKPGLRGRHTSEVAITDEVYTNRPPIKIHLKKGANLLVIKAPHGSWKGKKSWKWCFTAVPVAWDGQRATELPGIRFSAEPE